MYRGKEKYDKSELCWILKCFDFYVFTSFFHLNNLFLNVLHVRGFGFVSIKFRYYMFCLIYQSGAETCHDVCPFVQGELLIFMHASKRSSECFFQFAGQSYYLKHYQNIHLY